MDTLICTVWAYSNEWEGGDGEDYNRDADIMRTLEMVVLHTKNNQERYTIKVYTLGLSI